MCSTWSVWRSRLQLHPVIRHPLRRISCTGWCAGVQSRLLFVQVAHLGWDEACVLLRLVANTPSVGSDIRKTTLLWTARGAIGEWGLALVFWVAVLLFFSCVLHDSAVHTTVTVARRCGWMSLAAHRSESGVSCSSCGVYPWSGVSPWAFHGVSQRVCGTTRHQQKPIGLPMTSMSGLFIECWIDTGRTESGARPRTWGTKGLTPAIRPRSIRVLRRSLPL